MRIFHLFTLNNEEELVIYYVVVGAFLEEFVVILKSSEDVAALTLAIKRPVSVSMTSTWTSWNYISPNSPPEVAPMRLGRTEGSEGGKRRYDRQILCGAA